MTTRLSLAPIAALLLAACSGDPQLMNFSSSGGGPDEFLVAPSKPLEMPPNYTTLPAPDPGGPSRADPTPKADAVAALGGRPAALAPDGNTPDGGLVQYASRYGKEPAIRETLSDEDLEIRRRNNGLFLERVFNVNLYYDAYDSQQLDQQAAIESLRQAGVPTPSAPPAELKPR